MPARGLHPHQSAAAYGGRLGAICALGRRGHRLREAAHRLSQGHRPEEQDRRQACQGRRVPDEEEQGRVDQGLWRAQGQWAGGGSRRAGDADARSHEHSAGHGLGSAHAAGPEGRRHARPNQYRDPQHDGDSENARHYRGGRGRRRVCLHLQSLRHGSDDSRDAAARGAG